MFDTFTKKCTRNYTAAYTKRACRVILDYKVEDSSQAMDTLKFSLYMTGYILEKPNLYLKCTSILYLIIYLNSLLYEIMSIHLLT